MKKALIHGAVFALLITSLFNYFYNWPLWIGWILTAIVAAAVIIAVILNNKQEKTDYFCPLGIAILLLSLAILIISLLSSYNNLSLTTLIVVSLGALLSYLVVTSFLKNTTENKIIGAFLLSALLISLLGITSLTAPSSSTVKKIKDIITSSQKEIKAPDGSIFIASKTQSGWSVEIQSGVFKNFTSLDNLQKFIKTNYNKVYELYIPEQGVAEIYKTLSGEFEIYFNDALIKTTTDISQAKQYIYQNLLK